VARIAGMGAVDAAGTIVPQQSFRGNYKRAPIGDAQEDNWYDEGRHAWALSAWGHD